MGKKKFCSLKLCSTSTRRNTNETNEQKFKEWLDKLFDLFEIIEDEMVKNM
jgi:hypothetical protein